MERVKERSNFRARWKNFPPFVEDRARLFAARNLITGTKESQTVTPHLSQLFGTCEAPFEVRTIEESRAIAPSHIGPPLPRLSTGNLLRKRLGHREKSRRASESLFLHEAVTGHHFRSRYNRSKKNCRAQRLADTRFCRGWAAVRGESRRKARIVKEPINIQPPQSDGPAVRLVVASAASQDGVASKR